MRPLIPFGSLRLIDSIEEIVYLDDICDHLGGHHDNFLPIQEWDQSGRPLD